MDEIRILRDFGDRTNAVPPLQLNVGPAVLATLRSGAHNTTLGDSDDWFAGSLRPLFVLATAASILAVAIGLFAQQSLAELQDPLGTLFSPLVVALQ